ERPPHYDTFAEFQYAYHYGDMYVPYIKQEEPLKAECQHFLDSIRQGTEPLSNGTQGLQLVRILEASSASLKLKGASVDLQPQSTEHIAVKAESAPDLPHPAVFQNHSAAPPIAVQVGA